MRREEQRVTLREGKGIGALRHAPGLQPCRGKRLDFGGEQET
jgi:hypothetical protein